MIPNQWYPICLSHELRRRPLGLARMGRRLVAWRDGDGRAVVMDERCPHRGAARSDGRVRDGQLECPWHGFRFDAEGACRRIPCEGPDAKISAGLSTPAYPTREANGLLWLFWCAEVSEAVPAGLLPEIPWFEEFREPSRSEASAAIDWPMNYVRSIESNFDVHHFPFVHGSVLPGMGERIDPLEVEVEGTSIRTRGQLRRQGRERGLAFEIDFEVPSLTRLAFQGFSFIVADCPVDEHNTRRHAIYRQSWLDVPLLGRFLTWSFMMLDWKWLQNRQDLKIALGQRPAAPDLAVEHLVHADAGTAAYRKLRHDLLRKAGVEVQKPQ